ncbi:glycosyltransferase family 9 protein [Curtobacterium ammoniigenes]|uniref:glycosyltransferase family 9 protein n=1 Tax=Curtobacterium ammoniigenes TaxID=395387 RepID=UPI000A4A0997|nr:glycosyltransferase family 9 protein [Curtobacterium ammoniigenes]
MPRRVLVVRLDSFGDVLVCGPAIRAVAAAPDTEVVLLCGPQGAPAGTLLPGVARVVVWGAPWVTESARPVDDGVLDEFRTMIADIAPDEAIVLTSFHQSPLPTALFLRIAGVSRISGASVDHPGTLLDVRLRPGEDLDEDQPEPERALQIAAAAGYRLPVDDDGLLRVVVADARLPESVAALPRYVVVHPGASVPARSWAPEHHAALVNLLAQHGIAVVVTGSPGERALTARVAGTTAIDLGGATTPAELAVVLAHADAVVVGNTGPAHLAAAVGAPIVSLFSPVVPAIRWAPYGTRVALLGDQNAACRGSRARECPIAGHPCLASVSPDCVLRTLLDDFGVRPASPPGHED